MSGHLCRLLFVQRTKSLRRSRLLRAALAVGGSASIGLQIVAGWSAGPILSQAAMRGCATDSGRLGQLGLAGLAGMVS